MPSAAWAGGSANSDSKAGCGSTSSSKASGSGSRSNAGTLLIQRSMFRVIGVTSRSRRAANAGSPTAALQNGHSSVCG